MNAPIADAERAVVGALLLATTPEEAAAVVSSAGGLALEHFREKRVGEVWMAGRGLALAGTLPDAVSVAHALGGNGAHALVGELLDGIPRTVNVPGWADLVRARSEHPADRWEGSPDKGRDLADRAPQRRGLLSLGELATLPLPAWRIYGVLTGITLMWAGPGSFKTFLAIAWAVAVASGRKWCGRTVQQGAVLFIVGEGALRAFYNRVYVAAVAAGIPPDEVGALPIYATTGPVDLGRWDGLQAQEFLDAGRRVADKVGPIGLVIPDTVSRCVPGEENSQEVMQGFVAALDETRRVLGCDVLPIHHGNADGGRERGSSVLGGAVDGNLQLVPGAPDSEGRVPLSLYALKLKEADSGPGRDPIARLLAVRTVILGPDGLPLRDEMGLPRTSRVITEAGPEDTTAEESSDQALLEAIGAGISASKLCGALGKGKGTVLRDLARLQGRGLVRQTGMGKASRWIRA